MVNIKVKREDYRKAMNKYDDVYCNGGGQDLGDALEVLEEVLGIELEVVDE